MVHMHFLRLYFEMGMEVIVKGTGGADLHYIVALHFTWRVFTGICLCRGPRFVSSQ